MYGWQFLHKINVTGRSIWDIVPFSENIPDFGLLPMYSLSWILPVGCGTGPFKKANVLGSVKKQGAILRWVWNGSIRWFSFWQAGLHWGIQSSESGGWSNWEEGSEGWVRPRGEGYRCRAGWERWKGRKWAGKTNLAYLKIVSASYNYLMLGHLVSPLTILLHTGLRKIFF